MVQECTSEHANAWVAMPSASVVFVGCHGRGEKDDPEISHEKLASNTLGVVRECTSEHANARVAMPWASMVFVGSHGGGERDDTKTHRGVKKVPSESNDPQILPQPLFRVLAHFSCMGSAE